MKKLIVSLILMMMLSPYGYCGPVDTTGFPELVTGDDVTINWLNNFRNKTIDTLNSFPGDNIQAGTITTDAFSDNANLEYRWGEAFNNFIYTGLIPPTGAGLSTTTTAGTAYVKNDTTKKMKRVVKDATAHTYTASKYTYVDLSNTGTFTYQETAIGAAEPSVTSNSIRLCRVTTNATDVTAVRDDRVIGVQLSTNEDFYVSGAELIYGGEDGISVDAGVIYIGSVRINKTSATSLWVTTATDYITNISEQGTNKFIYVYCDSTGNLKLDDNAPDYHDTSGNTTGIKYYYLNGGKYWRCLGQIRLDGVGSGKIRKFYQKQNLVKLDPPTSITTSKSEGSWTSLSCSSSIPPTSTLGLFGVYGTQAGATTGIFLRSTGGTGSAINNGGNCLVGYQTYAGEILCPTNTSQSIDHQETSGITAVEILTDGYYMDIRN